MPGPHDIDLKERPDFIVFLEEEKERTGIGSNLIRKLVPNLPDSLTRIRCHNIYTRRIRFITPEEYNFLVSGYAQLPTVERVDLTEEVLVKIEALMEEKRVGPSQISKALPRSLGFNVNIFRTWIVREIRTADKRHLKGVMDFLETYSPKPQAPKPKPTPPKLTPITQEYLTKLEAEIERTNVTPSKMVKILGESKSLASRITSWRKGENKEAHPHVMEYVLELYSKLPDPRQW
ncbi:hypothetical protein [Roseivirga sp. 4D4]|uniref:hypothetical protein n=1 Tax=Roseivirga sp. 4D4 TaxID=1889784 RepID=UPI001112F461|nr:hypothetical protein [Roseivirga sp. 4D4]